MYQWLGFILGIIGMAVWSSNTKLSRWSGVFWILSSAFWIGAGLQQESSAMVLRELINIAFFAIGLWRWFRPPS